MTYQHDRAWSDKFIPALRGVVGPLLLEESSLQVDREQAADLVVFTARTLCIACRVRRSGYEERYPFDFTIRARRENGVKTELTKIVDGWGDWFVYGHASDSREATLSRWFVLDLNVFRAQMIRDEETRTHAEISNGDGTSFVAYDVRRFPPELVIEASQQDDELDRFADECFTGPPQREVAA